MTVAYNGVDVAMNGLVIVDTASIELPYIGIVYNPGDIDTPYFLFFLIFHDD